MSEHAHILVVDDEPTNRLTLSTALEQVNYRVSVAEDGFRALEVARREKPDLVLLDMMMPGRSGLEVCRLLRAEEATRDVPVIFVTVVGDVDTLLEAFSAGGCDYVIKPYRVGEVVARVGVHVRIRQAEADLRGRYDRLQELTRRLELVNAELAESERLDRLTRVLNRSSWEVALRSEHDRYLRSGRAYSVIMLDLDHFRRYNEVVGHAAGDDCLRTVADTMTELCRQVDAVGRYGGEEFAVLAPETEGVAAVRIAERIRRAIWNLEINHPSSAVARRLTASLGVASAEGNSFEDVVRASEAALVVAKRAGRNMVYCPQLASEKRAAVATGAPTVDGDAPPPCVLVVDDEPTNQIVCRGTLERAGYRVCQARDGLEALTVVREELPDVIVMDVMMPHLDGLECTRRLKGDPETADIPVIIVSALGEGEDIIQGLNAGADEYLTKPFRVGELTLRVRSIARQRRDRIDLLRSHEMRGEHVRVLSRLVEFCRLVGTSQDEQEVFAHTVTAVSEIALARRISIMCPTEEGDALVVAKSCGIAPEHVEEIRVPVGKSIAGKVFASGNPILVNDARTTQETTSAYDSPYFVSVPILSAPLVHHEERIGVLNVTDRQGGQPFEDHELEYIDLVSRVAASTIQEIRGRGAYQQASDLVMVALAKLAEHRDNDTGLHLDRVTRYCLLLANELRKQPEFAAEIDDTFLFNLQRSVPLHDIGKVGIPDGILQFPGRLDNAQMEIMRTHAALGADTIRMLANRAEGITFLEMAADVAHYHHERFDGTGYPVGLRGDQIPLAARIASVADVYDALTTKRVYKDAMPPARAAAIIIEGSGSQFDPRVVDAFLACEDEFASLAEELADHSSAARKPARALAAVAAQTAAGCDRSSPSRLGVKDDDESATPGEPD
jgi:diguanylate cyclase (GGDEF)-like protein